MAELGFEQSSSKMDSRSWDTPQPLPVKQDSKGGVKILPGREQGQGLRLWGRVGGQTCQAGVKLCSQVHSAGSSVRALYSGSGKQEELTAGSGG